MNTKQLRHGSANAGLAIDLEVDIQSSLGCVPAQGLGLVSNTFLFRDEKAERIGIYSQRVLKPSPNSEPSARGAKISG